MEIVFKKSFAKALKATPKHVQFATQEVVNKLAAAKSLDTSGLDYTKMEGQKKGENYYRVRIEDWRMGIEYVNPRVVMIIVLSRGNIYKQFPPK